MEEKRVRFGEVDKPFSEYPKGTVFVQSDNVFIPLPSKEEIEEYVKKKESTSQ